MIEDSCASIIRFGHLDTATDRFMGRFKVVSKQNPSLVLGTGSYTKDGFRNGEFVLYYTDGKLEAKGRFKNNLYDGPWEFYYPNGNLACKANFKKNKYYGKCEFYYDDGKPYAFMKINEERCEISDVWARNGEKIVSEGKGYCSVSTGSIHWYGKLVKGVPDSIWSYSFLHKLAATESKLVTMGDITIYDNLSSQPIEEIFGNESFRDGQFIKGQNKAQMVNATYTDRSRISFLPPIPTLRVFNCDRLTTTNIACDGTDYYKRFRRWRVLYFK